VASGVPALVLFSIGAIAATIGIPSWLVWTLSIAMGFLQAFTYAEIAGLFPNKSGGASVYGAIAWIRYSKVIAPISVWCNWFAWSPVLAIGSGLAAGYLLSVFFQPDAAINTWHITLLDLGQLKEGLTLRINATFMVGAILLLIVFAIQHRGILGAAKVQMVIGLASLVPLIVIGTVPLLTGDVLMANFQPFVPLAFDASKNPIPGTWNLNGWSLFMGGMFIAAWSTYAFETAVCYTSEFKNPTTDTFKAIFYSGLLCLFVFTIVPIAFQGVLGLKGMLDPAIYDGTGVAKAMTRMIGGGALIGNLLIVMLILALLLSVMTSMAGSSRTLYQASVDGWLPKYLSKVNQHGAPTYAMWSDLAFNLFLLLMSDYVFILAMSNVNYIIFNFLNLNAGWIHRMDRPDSSVDIIAAGGRHTKRPYRAPAWLLASGVICSFINLVFLGMGANVWGKNTLVAGLGFAALILPVFLYRHYITDRGRFPHAMQEDMFWEDTESIQKRAGALPWITLVAGVIVVYVSYRIGS